MCKEKNKEGRGLFCLELGRKGGTHSKSTTLKVVVHQEFFGRVGRRRSHLGRCRQHLSRGRRGRRAAGVEGWTRGATSARGLTAAAHKASAYCRFVLGRDRAASHAPRRRSRGPEARRRRAQRPQSAPPPRAPPQSCLSCLVPASARSAGPTPRSRPRWSAPGRQLLTGRAGTCPSAQER